ncbi:hypothetical protein J5N97_014111 [Dioscorea zingiberensis]|uniref:Phytochrome chromophore attachment site domain-containing protein n=1 Tax=Dioscorea zingiberensis TaxID=325984 RepID=A0A9D5CTD0_9LILI|nr:hypothetical protein J5N97_014111 [Dioscorea zingiberensis]
MGSALKWVKEASSQVKQDKWKLNGDHVKLFLKNYKEAKDVKGAEEFCGILKQFNRLDSRAYDSLIRTYDAAGEKEPSLCQRLVMVHDFVICITNNIKFEFNEAQASHVDLFCGTNGVEAFYAILHRVDVGIVIDLEPARTEDPALSIAGAVQSQKLAVRAISRLQALPGGDINLLCDAVVTHVRELTGYDRVMVYKFHDDEHGEVVAESRRDDLEPYLGLHYPATDIPQASRFLFKQNRVRMIADCNAAPVPVIQDDNLMQPLCLVGSTLRAPHGCHAQYMNNMGSIASLVMAVIINSSEDESSSRNSMKLWGLVVCHHTSPLHPLPSSLRL